VSDVLQISVNGPKRTRKEVVAT